jgi:hypothetical protein
MVQVVFERVNLPYDVSSVFVTMNSTGPRQISVSGCVSAAKMIVNKYTQVFMVITQERIGACFTTDSQCFARGCDRQRQDGNGLECLGVFGQRAVVRDQRNIKAQFQSYRSRVAKAAPGNERDAHTLFTCVLNCAAIALRNVAARIEESPVEIKSQKTYRHEDNKVNEER